MECLSPLDLGSLSDDGLDSLIDELTEDERAVSRERRLVHEYLRVLGVKRGTHLNGDPAGWIGLLIDRENAVSYRRSLVQGRLDILKSERRERRRGWSLATLGAEALVRALSRPKRRPTTSQ
jgi:hypothetical protein